MIEYKCDICGQKMYRWINITIMPDAASQEMNIYDLLKFKQKKQICEDCMSNITKNALREVSKKYGNSFDI